MTIRRERSVEIRFSFFLSLADKLSFDTLLEHSFKSLNSIQRRGREESMEWLTNANTIVGLIVGIIGITGYIFAASTYLLGKAHLISRNSGSKTKSSTQKSSIPYQPLSLVEWIEVLGQGLVDTADFVIGLFPFADEYDEDEPIITRLGVGGFICGCGVILGELILGFTFYFILSNLGLSNAPGASIAISAIILFMVYSLMYIYHVGIRVEIKQLEQYRQFEKE